MPRTLALLTDEFMLRHDNGPGHPERPDRLRALLDTINRLDLPVTTPRPAALESVQRVHDPGYVREILALKGESRQLDPDTFVCPDSVECALLAAGASIGAVRAVMQGEADASFALPRPPGHHAERDAPMGFCLFNNIAVAAQSAIDDLGARRILIIDWDVHHANGTQHLFEDRADVAVFSIHQWPLWPGSGRATETGHSGGAGYTINVPVPPGSTDDLYHHAFADLLVPAARAFEPDLLLVSAGFDADARDPLAGVNLTAAGFATLAAIARSLAHELAGGRIALFLEGGYDLSALSEGFRACVEALTADEPPPLSEPAPLDDDQHAVLDAVRSAHAGLPLLS